MEQVELHQAFMYDCPECGRENFVRAIHIETSDEEQDDMIRLLAGIEDWEEVPDDLHGMFLVAPSNVTCEHCGEELETAPPMGMGMPEDEEEDEDEDEF